VGLADNLHNFRGCLADHGHELCCAAAIA
jgi:hypothetical protein